MDIFIIKIHIDNWILFELIAGRSCSECLATKFPHARQRSSYLFHRIFRIFSCTVNYVCDGEFNAVTSSPRRIKIRDKPTINKARTHNSSGIKTHLPVYRKLNLPLRTRANGSCNRSSSTGKDCALYSSAIQLLIQARKISCSVISFSVRFLYGYCGNLAIKVIKEISTAQVIHLENY